MKGLQSRDAKGRFLQSLGPVAKSLSSRFSGEQISSFVERTGDRVLALAQTKDDIDTLGRLIIYVDKTVRRLRERNLAGAVANSHVIDIQDDAGSRLVVLDELRRRAFGKCVVFRTESDEIRAYRIAQANESYIENGDYVLNRLSPVARMLVSAEVGDTLDLPRLGEVEVIAVTIQDRSIGLEPDNFDHIVHRERALSLPRISVANAKESLRTWQGEIELAIETGKLAEETPKSPDAVEIAKDDEASLGSIFYTSSTKDQEEIISGSPSGLVLVQGVAGSGKTSVALGRTKALCDARFFPRESSDWDDFFAPESAVGFVLNNQLIDYLKQTRDELNLHAMPVLEYAELRQRLVRQRAALLEIRLRRDDGGQYVRVAHSTPAHAGTMDVLYVFDQIVGQAYADALGSCLEEFAAQIPSGNTVPKAVWREAWRAAGEEIRSLVDSLASRENKKTFVCTGLAARVERILKISREKAKETWLNLVVHDRPIPAGQNTAAIEVLASAGYEFAVKQSGDEFKKLLATGEQVDRLFRVRERLFSDDAAQSRLSHATRDELAKLLREGELYGNTNGRLRRVTWHQLYIDNALQQGALHVRPTNSLDAKWIRLEKVKLSNSKESSAEDRRLRKFLQSRLVDSLRLPTLFSRGIEGGIRENLGLEEGLLHVTDAIAARISDGQLCDEDIDLLLGLAHLISDGYSGEVPHLRPPSFYSTVFVDEVQDFSEVQLFLMGSQADPKRRAVTVVGDFCQQLTEVGVRSLEACFPYNSKGQTKVVYLDKNKRQEEAADLSSFTQWFRETFVEGSKEGAFSPQLPMVGIRRGLYLDTLTESQIAGALEDILSELPAQASVAVICPSSSIAAELERKLHDVLESLFRRSAYTVDHRDLTKPYYVHFTTPLATKGLEFDWVIAPFFDRFDLSHRLEANAAYVTVSRARRRLHILSTRELFSLPLDG